MGKMRWGDSSTVTSNPASSSSGTSAGTTGARRSVPRDSDRIHTWTGCMRPGCHRPAQSVRGPCRSPVPQADSGHPVPCYAGRMTEAPSRALRKDAALNRERLLAAARELFAEHGLNVTLNDIAHHAGVGVGTAYRRFANKEEVIDALFEEGLQQIATVANEALDEPDAWEALVMFLTRSLHMQFGDRGLNQIMNNPALGHARVSEARTRIAPLITALVDRAKKQGVV